MAGLTLKALADMFAAGNIVDKPGDQYDAAKIVADWRQSPGFAQNAPVGDQWASIFTDPWGSQQPTPSPGRTNVGTPESYSPTSPTASSPTPAPSSGLQLAGGITPASLSDPGSSPVATGFPMLRESFEMMLAADQNRRAAIDQEIQFQSMFSQLLGNDPAVAADLAVRLGMPGLEPDLNYLNRFSKGAVATYGGNVGTSEVSLPFSYSRGQMRFLDANPTVARAVQSVSSWFRRPDALSTSAAMTPPISGVPSAFGFS